MSLSRKTIEDIRIAIKEDVMCALIAGDNTAFTSFGTPSGYIEITSTKKGESFDFGVYHDNDSERECPNIIAALQHEFHEESMWEECEDELKEDSGDIYQRNGFASEADFWRWKEG